MDEFVRLDRKELTMFAFLVGSLFPLFALYLGIKALTPAGIELSEGKKLSRSASTVIGIVAILFSIVTMIGLYAYCVLRVRFI